MAAITSTDAQIAGTVSHEMGHNFGMSHTNIADAAKGVTAACYNQYLKRVMDPRYYSTPPTKWTSCSKLFMNYYLEGFGGSTPTYGHDSNVPACLENATMVNATAPHGVVTPNGSTYTPTSAPTTTPTVTQNGNTRTPTSAVPTSVPTATPTSPTSAPSRAPTTNGYTYVPTAVPTLSPTLISMAAAGAASGAGKGSKQQNTIVGVVLAALGVNAVLLTVVASTIFACAVVLTKQRAKFNTQLLAEEKMDSAGARGEMEKGGVELLRPQSGVSPTEMMKSVERQNTLNPVHSSISLVASPAPKLPARPASIVIDPVISGEQGQPTSPTTKLELPAQEEATIATDDLTLTTSLEAMKRKESSNPMSPKGSAQVDAFEL